MYQSITITGRLGRDPEMKYLPSGDPICTFNVATDRTFNDKNGNRQKETTWFRVTVFGKQAETASKYLAKGRSVLVEGRLAVDPETGGPRVYTDKQGKTRAAFEIVANLMRFIEKLPANVEASGGGDDIPF